MPHKANLKIRSASVSASAGTGKTWMLVSRIIKLLLHGVKPDTVLAITFTRKAAAEMYTRLAQRLYTLASCDQTQLDKELQLLNLSSTPSLCTQARRLYELVLHAPRTVKTTTFHAFCNELLQRFPLEADVPPGFELVEFTADIESAAWDLLLNDATNFPDKKTARALEQLFDSCNGISNTELALKSFLSHRSDWWAYTEFQPEPVEYACEHLRENLELRTTDDPLPTFFTPEIIKLIIKFANLLSKHPTATNQKHQKILENCQLNVTQQCWREAYELLTNAFFTKNSTPLVRKLSKPQAKTMGEQGQLDFLQIHEEIVTQLNHVNALLQKIETYTINQAWYFAGSRLLHYYQQIKAEQRVLDFSDLEWKAYQLLNSNDNAHWVQFKLDEKIDHLLIDEFQDTNPTQWQLVKPLLQEMENSEDDKKRSVFLVGDPKQSIYRFRRANPELFIYAQNRLVNKLGAETVPLDTSWRSSPAIINFVNTLFSHGDLSKIITNFPHHKTMLDNLPGTVELLPLVDDAMAETETEVAHEPGMLRNPLLTPRSISENRRHYEAAKIVAQKIQTIISHNTLLGENENAKVADYADILILLRHRTHVEAYERALRETDIPYIGAGRGMLLASQEVKDLIMLLQVLTAPYNNLSLATVLRSPLFSCTDEDLMLLAKFSTGTWRERLAEYVKKQPQHERFARAESLLSRWEAIANALPVHDVLDRIFFEGDVVKRYEAAYPEHLRQRINANQTRFLELALELDSGRYPSIGKFLARFGSVVAGDSGAPDETPAANNKSKVRILTIHAAKGLEAPIVFLVDATNTVQSRQTYQALVNWPSDSAQPADFLLVGKKINQDAYTSKLIEYNNNAERRENANLFYVAVTRAKQHLFISGIAPRRGDNRGWFGAIASQYEQTIQAQEIPNNTILLEHYFPVKHQDHKTPSIIPLKNVEWKFDERLTRPLHFKPPVEEIHPSEQVSESLVEEQKMEFSLTDEKSAEPFALLRGKIIHRILQLLCESNNQTQIIQKLAAEQDIDLTLPSYHAWLEEATKVFSHPDTDAIFNASSYIQAYNEIPISFHDNNYYVYGVIDRIVVSENTVKIVDYKTHTYTSIEYQTLLAEYYKSQLQYYALGAKKLWPDKNIVPLILFTHNSHLIEVPIDRSQS